MAPLDHRGTRAFPGLPDLLVARINRGGAVLAANDIDIRQFNQDTYRWTRAW